VAGASQLRTTWRIMAILKISNTKLIRSPMLAKNSKGNEGMLSTKLEIMANLIIVSTKSKTMEAVSRLPIGGRKRRRG
jgi:hypothetical protein